MKKLTVIICLLMIFASVAASAAVIRHTLQQDTVTVETMAEEATPETGYAEHGYVVTGAGGKISDGIHTDNLYQRRSELEQVMQDISDKTANKQATPGSAKRGRSRKIKGRP